MFISTYTKKAMVIPVALSLAFAGFSQTPITTPAELKTACETSAGNIITLNESVKISMPTYSTSATQVNCGCTVILNNASTFELEMAHLQFAGAFTIQSSGKGDVKLTNSRLRANSISMNLGGEGSSLQASQSAVEALAGNATIVFGTQAKMELYGTISRFAREGFKATGVMSISAGARFLGSTVDMTIQGNAGLSLQTTGEETLLKIENTAWRSELGAVSVKINGPKATLEAVESGFYPATSATMHLLGAESSIKLGEFRFEGPFSSTTKLSGGVDIIAANGTAIGGKIEMSRLNVFAGGGFSAKASVGNEAGGVKLENSTFNTDGDIYFETGRKGTTETKDNSINSKTRITVKTGIEGSCLAANRVMTAPIVNACGVAPVALKANRGGVSGAINVYPNPATKGTAILNLEGTSGVSDIFITDMNGRMVKQWKAFEGNTLSINELNNGIYNLQVVNQKTGDKTSKRFVITQ